MQLIDLKFDNFVKDKKSFEKLSSIGLPTKRTEQFRDFDISEIFSNSYMLKTDVLDMDDNLFHKENEDFYTLFVINGIVDMKNSVLPKTVKHEIKDKNFNETSDALYYLGESFIEKENTILIEDNLDKPLMIKNIFEGESCFLPSSLNIILKDGCKADVVEIFTCEGLNNSFVNLNRVLTIGENAILNYTKLQNIDTSDVLILNFIPQIAKNATFNGVMVDLGSKISLNIIDTVLAYEYGSFSCEGIIKLNKEKRAGNIASMLHVAENTKSHIICKHILDDASHALFEVVSVVNHDARFSKTFQNSQTILLEDGARINANPKLILHTDELEAAHGATTGSLNEEELYYMMSRGIDEKKASQMLINAIELQVTDKIENELVKELVLRFIEG